MCNNRIIYKIEVCLFLWKYDLTKIDLCIKILYKNGLVIYRLSTKLIKNGSCQHTGVSVSQSFWLETVAMQIRVETF